VKYGNWKLSLHRISVPLGTTAYYTFKKVCFTLEIETITFNCGSQHENLTKGMFLSSSNSDLYMKNRNTPIHTKKQAIVVLGIYSSAAKHDCIKNIC